MRDGSEPALLYVAIPDPTPTQRSDARTTLRPRHAPPAPRSDARTTLQHPHCTPTHTHTPTPAHTPRRTPLSDGPTTLAQIRDRTLDSGPELDSEPDLGLKAETRFRARPWTQGRTLDSKPDLGFEAGPWIRSRTLDSRPDLGFEAGPWTQTRNSIPSQTLDSGPDLDKVGELNLGDRPQSRGSWGTGRMLRSLSRTEPPDLRTLVPRRSRALRPGTRRGVFPRFGPAGASISGPHLQSACTGSP